MTQLELAVCPNCGASELNRIDSTLFKCCYCQKTVAADKKNPPVQSVEKGASTEWGEEVAEKCSAGIFELLCGNTPLDIVSTGTGFAISDKGYILTNSHVILCGDTEDINPEYKYIYAIRKAASKTVAKYVAKAVYYHEDKDLALLKIECDERDDIHVISLGRFEDIKVGQKAYAMGNALGQGVSFTSGDISALNRKSSDGTANILTNVNINHGNSGGPLLNKRGELIGIMTSSVSSAVNMNYAKSIEDIRAFLEECEMDTGLSLVK